MKCFSLLKSLVIFQEIHAASQNLKFRLIKMKKKQGNSEYRKTKIMFFN